MTISSFYDINGRIMATDGVESEGEQPTTELSPAQLYTALIYPRVVGGVVFLSSICMLFMAVKRRDQYPNPFHRLVLGMSVHLLIWGVFFMYGTAAVPRDDVDSLGNIGTVGTCTAQGFILYLCEMTSLFYYCSFSVYSVVGVLNNFEKANIVWVEKWLHLVVHIYPLSSAFYLLSINAFNNSGIGSCYGAISAPYMCNPADSDSDSDINSTDCERGATTITISIVMVSIQYFNLFFILSFPTAVMIVLYFIVKKRQKQIHGINSKTVAIQAIIYLLPIYFTEVPFLVSNIIGWSNNNLPFITMWGFLVFGLVFYGLFGLFAFLSYYYFSVSTATTKEQTKNSLNNLKTSNTISDVSEIIEGDETSPVTTSPRTTTTTTTISTTITEEETGGAITKKTKPEYSFNIFDGTNASGEYKEFIHDGDSDDERVDLEQTNHWDACQDYL